MTFKYSKYGFINALISLIPIFPIFTLLPMIGIAAGLGDVFSNCEIGYIIAYWISLSAAIVATFAYIRKVIKRIDTDQKNSKYGFRLYSLLLYTLINSFGFIVILGPSSACHGDGQTILACMFSGPIASLVIYIMGILTDVIIYISNKKKNE